MNENENPMAPKLIGDSRFSRAGGSVAVLLSLTLGVLGATLLLSLLTTMTVVSAPSEDSALVGTRNSTSVSTVSLDMASLYVTKTIDPNPFWTSGIDPGGPVSICFTVKRRALDVVLACDVSGSMNELLTASKAIARNFVSYLQNTDRAAIVPLSTTVYLTRIQSLTPSKSKILGAIDGLRAGGRTNVGQGINVSHRELITPPPNASGTIKAIVLLSDGYANEPDDYPGGPEEYARDKAEAAASNGVEIYTIGFGDNPNENLLRKIAEIGHGEYFSASSASSLAQIYLTIALELHDLVITDVLTAGVQANCPQEAPYSCSPGDTVTWPVSDSLLADNPLTLCFGAEVFDLECDYEGPTNDPGGSRFCYRSAGGEGVCRYLNRPTITVICRKVYLPVVVNCYSPYCSPGIVNGDFELGWDNWTGWTHGGELSQTITSDDRHSGNFSARLGDPAYKCSTGVPVGSAWMEQTVLVPCKGSPELSFSYSITTYDENYPPNNRWDRFEVTINSSRVLRDMPPGDWHGCDSPPKETGWVSRTVDLSGYKGSCVTIRFANWNWPDKKYNTWTYVDDVRIDP